MHLDPVDQPSVILADDEFQLEGDLKIYKGAVDGVPPADVLEEALKARATECAKADESDVAGKYASI